MTDLTMTTPRQLRAAINVEYEDDLKRLGDLLGHTSITQTIEFILKAHLKTELKQAEKYMEERFKGR